MNPILFQFMCVQIMNSVNKVYQCMRDLVNFSSRVLGIAALCCLAMVDVNAAEPEKGLAISQEADTKNSGFVDFRAELTMRIVNQQGSETLRKLDIKTLEGIDEGDKTITIFTFPKDIRGAGFLTHTKKISNDDQWLYLPSIKRVKKISSKNKRSPFFGSEFAFEDLASQEVEKYTYTYLKEESIDGLDTHVIQRTPKDPQSAYSKLIVWMDKAELQIRRIEYYDRKNTLLKTLVATEYQRYEGKFWRASKLHMLNHQNKKQTYLEWQNYRFGTGLKQSDLEQTALMRPLVGS
jgi:outer membrane lipoprotein-sorting protein